jgi:hypothetical protein
MDLMLLRIFQRQVADQCRFTLAGVPLINQVLQGEGANQDQLWIGCQMFVVGSGNASKALWGEGRNREKISEARQPLRESLDVDDASPLYSLELRNHFEHYDERIDRWWNNSPNHIHVDRIIGPPELISGVEDTDRFRVLDPTGPDGPRIIFWGQTFDLQPIASECERVQAIAETEAAKPHWEPNTSGSGQQQ